MSNKLRALAEQHNGKVVDKWTLYFFIYEKLFSKMANDPIRFLEIGVQNGGSLELWSKYFPHAKSITGVDIDPKCGELTFSDPRISVVVGDATLDETQKQVSNISEFFDVIIDDGSHTSADIIRTFLSIFPKLEEGGVYIIEDLHCSYWSAMGGGLFDPFSSISFLKALVDIIHHPFWRVEKRRSDLLKPFFDRYGMEIDEESLSKIQSVEFYNSCCVIQKTSPEKAMLGERELFGQDASVQPYAEIESMNGVGESFWDWRSRPPADELREVLSENQRLKSLLEGMLSSKSWRMTAPLRSLLGFLRRSVS